MTINLLPWRDQQRKKKIKIFNLMFITAISSAVLLIVLVNFYVIFLIDNQKIRHQMLQKEINFLEQKNNELPSLKQESVLLLTHMSMLQELHATQVLLIHLFDELIKIMPSDVFVYRLERHNEKLTLWGKANSHESISSLMRHIDQNNWLHNPCLLGIRQVDEQTQSNFSLSFVLGSKNQLEHDS